MFIKTTFVRLLTCKFASAIALYPFVLVDPEVKITRRLVQHERIHLSQQKEMLILPFYFFYLFNYLFNMIRYRSAFIAYKNICFERECYANDGFENYLGRRKIWNWVKYL